MQPTSRKGQMRVAIEDRMHEAAERGVRTIILRAGDFFGGGRGSWFDLVIAKEIGATALTYPGPLDVVHEWAYLPDLAAAMVRLAAVRDRLEPFETFGFPGHAVTGREFTTAIAKAVRRELQVKRMSWWLIHALAADRAALPRIVGDGLSLAASRTASTATSSRPRSATFRTRRLTSRVARALRDLGVDRLTRNRERPQSPARGRVR